MAERSGDWASASIVIPAHDEADALPGVLASLLDQDLRGMRLEVVVVVNGSTDGTVAAAQSFVGAFAACGHRLRVVEMGAASKALALNRGDEEATSFPRLYLDADIRLSRNAVRRSVEALSAASAPMLAAPMVDVAKSAALAARHYGHVWSQLPYVRSHVPGVGFYGVNEAGRRRWWRFPTRIGADDKFVRLHFDSDEAMVIGDASFTVFLPERTGELLQVRARWTSLNREIVRHCPGLDGRDRSRWVSSFRELAAHPSVWPEVPAFLMVWTGAWGLSLLRTVGIGPVWARAASSVARTPRTAASPERVSAAPAPTPSTVEVPASEGIHVVVVMFNSIATAPGCIERLLASRGIGELRITVVDNASSDDGAQAVAERFPDVEVITNELNVGFAAAVNPAVKESHSRWLAIINPDVEVRPDTIASCVAYLEEHPAVGCVGVPAVRADGSVNDRSFFMRPTLWSELMLALGAHRIAPGSRVLNPEQHLAHRPQAAPLPVDAVAGCFTVIDRALFEHLGGYDEDYFLCGEDLDLSVRAVEAGAAPTVVAVPPILHHSEGSFATRGDALIAYLRGRSQFERRWWPASHAVAAEVIRTAGILARLVALEILRSPRRADLAHVWAHRREWTGPHGPRSRRRRADAVRRMERRSDGAPQA